MPRGVDGEQFNPKHRTVNDKRLRLGFVGRVTPEKGVRLLRGIDKELVRRGLDDFRITIVGDGSEVEWLKWRLEHGEFTGVLRGAELARAYANMDLFVFPSRTDTFGKVVQEAAASGVPSVVTNEGGPKHLVVPGKTGLIAETNAEFVATVVELALNRDRLREMGEAARGKVSGVSWDAAFEKTYAAYRACLPREAVETTVQKKSRRLAHDNKPQPLKDRLIDLGWFLAGTKWGPGPRFHVAQIGFLPSELRMSREKRLGLEILAARMACACQEAHLSGHG
jgi:phosphatidylinositol alpha 1,6-mannosyltransferase